MKRNAHRALAALLGAAVVGLSASRAQGGAPPPRPAPLQGTSPLTTLMPQVQRLPAPAWVKPGTRLTFYAASATVQGHPYTYIRDDKGRWLDDFGNAWKRFKAPSASGHGFTQVNVVALEPARAVADVRSYTYANVSDGPVFLTAGALIGLPGAGGDYWANPQALQTLVERRTADLMILRGPYTIQGRTYQTVRIQTVTASGGAGYVYDLATGVLLRATTATATKASTYTKNTKQGTTWRGGATILAQTTFRSIRQLRIPWAAGAAPRWLPTLRAARYVGDARVFIPGSPVIPLPATMTLQITKRGANWLLYTQTAVLQSAPGMPAAPNQTVRISGAAQLGGFWVPPTALGALRAGQTLDTDPYTRVTTVVARVGADPRGRRVVQIAEIGRGQRFDYTYDATSGLLVYLRAQNRFLNMVQQFQLTGAQ